VRQCADPKSSALTLKPKPQTSTQAVPPVYDLYAVSNHYGGYGGGHYTAYCCDGQGAWHCFDDSHVSPIDAARVQSPAAYVLFYRRRAEAAADPGASLPPPQHG